MIERKFIAANIKEFQIQEYITQSLKNVGHSHTKLQRTPLGEKIIIFTSRPGLIVGKKGENIKKLTKTLKKKFKLENPQIEINEVENIFLDAQIVAERIASTLERFGSQRFKGVGHSLMQNVMQSGAYGIEILMSGKIPSSRAKRWRFYQGYLKKCGDIALTGVRTAYASANLKTGKIGISVKIMPPDTVLPDKIKMYDEPVERVEEVKEGKKTSKKKKTSRKPRKKKEAKPEEKKEESGKEGPKKEEPKETQKPEVSETQKSKISEKPKEEKKEAVKAEEKKEAAKPEEAKK